MSRNLLLWLFLPALAVVVYLPGIGYPFIYDDHGVIAENAFLTQPDAWSRVISLDTFTDPNVIDGQRPVLLVTYLIDNALHGLHPVGWRVTNLFLHALALIGLAGLWMRLGLSPAWSGTLALLCGLHPLAVEAVQSPAFREDPLAVVLVLAFLHLLIVPKRPLEGRAPARPQDGINGTRSRGSVTLQDHSIRIFAAALFYILALLAKESAVLAPALLILLRFLFPHRFPRWRTLLPVLVLCAAATIAFILISHYHRPLQALGMPWNGRSLLFPATIWTAPWLLVDYVLRFLIPLGLSIDYVVDPVTSPFKLRGVIGWGGLFLLILLMVKARVIAGPQHAWLRLGAGWTLAFFLPVSNLVPLFNPLADRYAYAMLPGLVLMTGTFAMCIRSHAHRQALAVLLALILGGLTSARLTAWQSDTIMWTAVLDVQPASDRAHTWLGLLIKADGNRDQARHHFQRARDLNPHEVTAAINLAILDGEAGRLRAAEQQLRDVLARRPDHREARANLAVALDLQGRTAEAQAIRNHNDAISD